jgi:hypothetical protein
MLRLCSRIAFVVVVTALFHTSIVRTTALAQPTGSGSITGVFSDTVPTLAQPPAPTIIPLGDFVLAPHSRGAGTNEYHWGILNNPRYYLDGVEMSLEDIVAILPPDDPTFNSRVMRDFIPSTNQLIFTGFDFTDQPQGETFVAGRLEYTNGVSTIGTSVETTELTLTSDSLTPEFVQELNEQIVIRTSPNVLDENGMIIDDLSADFIFFQGRPELGSFRVFEDESTFVEVLVEFNSLDLIGFGAVGDPSVGFLSPYVTVPEPATAILAVLLGCGALGCRSRRKQ